jgi:hypothetical protein
MGKNNGGQLKWRKWESNTGHLDTTLDAITIIPWSHILIELLPEVDHILKKYWLRTYNNISFLWCIIWWLSGIVSNWHAGVPGSIAIEDIWKLYSLLYSKFATLLRIWGCLTRKEKAKLVILFAQGDNRAYSIFFFFYRKKITNSLDTLLNAVQVADNLLGLCLLLLLCTWYRGF